MNKTANRILLWTTPEGKQLSLIIVKDNSKSSSDDEYRWLEVCEYNKDEKQWKTKEKVDYIGEIDDFGIPETLID